MPRHCLAFIRLYAKRYPLTCLCVALIWYLCLFKPPRTPLDHIAGIDKSVHVLMYLGTCSLLWIEHLRSHRREDWRKLLPWAVIAPITMSGAVELVQEYCTETRSGDWMDFLANSAGVLLAAALGHCVFKRYFLKH